MYRDWRPYVPVAQRRANAAKEIARRSKKGTLASPVVINGRVIASTFWGKAWCNNLERYSDYANRLPRGRSYVRNGSVIDLQVGAGTVKALVSGSSIYEIDVRIESVPAKLWAALCSACAGNIDSLVELLRGQFSRGVMDQICRPETGLFPNPKHIAFSCTCPDWASMCKHVAAVLYGVGARLDTQPNLLFVLRGVDAADLIKHAGKGTHFDSHPASERALDDSSVAELFGLDMAAQETKSPANPPVPAGAGRSAKAPVSRLPKKVGTEKVVKTVKPPHPKRSEPAGKKAAAKPGKKSKHQ